MTKELSERLCYIQYCKNRICENCWLHQNLSTIDYLLCRSTFSFGIKWQRT